MRLSALPRAFHLNKKGLRYGWAKLSEVPDHCMCLLISFSLIMICSHGGLTFVRHNELHDLTASWLQEVCHDVPLTGESITPGSANCDDDDAQADIHYNYARGFWEGAFFNIRVFHPNAPSYRHTQIGSLSIWRSCMFAMWSLVPLHS